MPIVATYILIETDDHTHTVGLDADGNGTSSTVNDHSHEVEAFNVQEANGHTHGLRVEEKSFSKSLAYDIPFDYNFPITAFKAEAWSEEETISLEEDVPVLYIEGYASTNAIDRHDDIVDQASITFDQFMNNPIMLFQHNPDWPIGKVVKLERDVEMGDDKRGLLCRAAIIGDTMKSMEVQDQIKSGILKGFSIHGKAQSRKKKCGQGHCHYVLEGLNLLEISVVSIPANQETLFEVAKSLVAQIENSINHGQGTGSPGNKSMEDNTMNEDEMKTISDLIKKTISATKQELPPDLQAQLEAALALTEKVDALAADVAAIKEQLSAEEGGDDAEAAAAAEAAATEAKLDEGSTVELEVDGVKKTLKLVDPTKLIVNKAQGGSSKVDELSVKKQLAKKAHEALYPEKK